MTKTVPPMIVTDTGVTVFLNGSVYTAANDHVNITKIRDAIATGDYDALPTLFDVRSNVAAYVGSLGADDFTLSGDFLCLDGKPFTFAVTDKVLSMIEAGQPATPIYNFLRKVRNNPLVAAQDELLLFCVANNFMIHEDGDIIAYKSVRGDYMDIHSGKFRNRVGDTNEMARDQVDPDRDRTCSRGLHFASYEYASTWAGHIDGVSRRLMVIKVNPADVVAIPSDYNNQKGRSCRYTVIAELTTGSPLPRREVYRDADLGIAPKRDNTAEIARKERVRDRWIEEHTDESQLLADVTEQRIDLEDRVNTILSLGGNCVDLEEELCNLDAEYDRLSRRCNVLDDKIAEIEAEIIALRA